MATLGATTIETKAAAHGGNVGNIVSAPGLLDTTDFSVSSTSVVEYEASRIAITPTASASRILITYALQCHINQLTGAGGRACSMLLYRDSTDLGPIISMRVLLTINDYTEHSGVFTHIDHPNTTSEVTYSLRAKNGDTSIVYWQHNYGVVAHGARGYAREIMGTPTNWIQP
jgi:hypothetical protein